MDQLSYLVKKEGIFSCFDKLFGVFFFGGGVPIKSARLLSYYSSIYLQTATMIVFVLKEVSLKQNKSHSRSLDLHLVFINEGLPE